MGPALEVFSARRMSLTQRTGRSDTRSWKCGKSSAPPQYSAGPRRTHHSAPRARLLPDPAHAARFRLSQNESACIWQLKNPIRRVWSNYLPHEHAWIRSPDFSNITIPGVDNQGSAALPYVRSCPPRSLPNQCRRFPLRLPDTCAQATRCRRAQEDLHRSLSITLAACECCAVQTNFTPDARTRRLLDVSQRAF